MADALRKIQIACNPLCWMNSDIPTLGSHIPVEQCLSEIALIGYGGVELEDPLRAGLGENPNMLSDRHLKLVAAWHGTQFLDQDLETELDALKRHMDYLQSHGGHVVNMAEVSASVHRDPSRPLSERPQLDSGQWAVLSEKLERAAELVATQGMRTAYHHHMGTYVQSEEDIDLLMKRTDTLGLLLDTGHLVYAGGSVSTVLENHGSRITHVHAKNIRFSVLAALLARDASFPEAILSSVFTVPGDNGVDGRGGLDFRMVLDGLVKAGFEGWIVMEAEQDPSLAHPLSYARVGYCALKLALYQLALHENAGMRLDCVGVELERLTAKGVGV